MLNTQEDTETKLQSLPEFQRASRHAVILKKVIVAFALVLLSCSYLLWQDLLPNWQSVLVAEIASLLLLVATLQAVWWKSRWRRQLLVNEDLSGSRQIDSPKNNSDSNFTFGNTTPSSIAINNQAVESTPTEKVEVSDPPSELPTKAKRSFHKRFVAAVVVQWRALAQFVHRYFTISTSTVCISICAALSLLLIISYWVPLDSEVLPTSSDVVSYTQNSVASEQIVTPIGAVFVAAALLLLAFVLLVLERFYAGHALRELPEAPAITYLLRLVITVTIILSAGVLWVDETRQWPLRVLVWAGVLPAAVAVELLLRVVLSLFSPPEREPELVAESFIAAMWRWPFQPFHYLHDELKQRFGVDLRQSWAFAYIRRASLPVLAVLLSVAWLLSGLAEIPIASRGVYERFGNPATVWQPGFHLGLPWPLGRVRLVENGVVHELTAASASIDDSDDEFPRAKPEQPATAESAPPDSANRLWDASHVAEKSQVIASETQIDGDIKQSFHIVNMDVRVMYRIGLSDDDALSASYNSADIPALIRSTANRILVNYFASRTLEGVLGERRTGIARDIGAALQTDLNTLNSGVEIMTTVVEAIHPPAAAANSYHAVQAAQINAQSIIARERGKAAEQVNLAQLRAGMTRDKATASARETLAVAEAAERRFSAERDAHQEGGKAFLFEQYLAQLIVGLDDAQLMVIDHRFPAASATIDLRNFSGAGVLDYDTSINSRRTE